MRILVIRNDKLGDFMLAWPAFALLKKHYPNAHVVALVPAYTQEMAELCPSIDEVIIDDQHHNAISDAYHLAYKIRAAKLDASISFFSELRTALALWLARVPTRIAPATKFAQIFINRRLKQRRSQSTRPEHVYNSDLVRHYVTLEGGVPTTDPAPPYLVFDVKSTGSRRELFCEQHHIAKDSALIIIHPGSGGSAINLNLDQFASLIRAVEAGTSQRGLNCYFIITAGPGEEETAQALSALLPGVPHCVYLSTNGLVDFSRFIATCNMFISGSTGTLHIAGALNIDTVAFYPTRRSATALRWQTLNSAEHRIAFTPDRCTGENEMLSINIVQCAKVITEFVQRQKQQNNA